MSESVPPLSGAALDAAVAKAQGYIHKVVNMYTSDCRARFDACVVVQRGTMPKHTRRIADFTLFQPSLTWEQGGPIVAREGISIQFVPGSNGDAAFWAASLPHGTEPDPEGGEMTSFASAYAETPLIAAMRAYVASAASGNVPEHPTGLTESGSRDSLVKLKDR